MIRRSSQRQPRIVVRAVCGICGDIDLAPDAVEVRMFEGTVVYRCPLCDMLNESPVPEAAELPLLATKCRLVLG